MPPERRRTRLHLRLAAQQQRTHAQQARQYAEQWYQALVAWQVEFGYVPVPPISYHAERAHRQGHGITTLGEFLPDQPTMLNLPVGQVPEGEVAQIISVMMLSTAFETSENGHLLDALRDKRQRKPESLLRPDGHWMRQTSPGYALAVLSLAVVLRDAQAPPYLAYCRRAFERAAASDEE